MTNVSHIFIGLVVSFICSLNIILYEASLHQSVNSIIKLNPYLLAVLLSCLRFVMFFGISLVGKLNCTLTKDEYIYLILAGVFTGIFRVCTFLSVSDTNSSVYANYSNTDILMFWVIDYFNDNIKKQHVKLDCAIMLAIVVCSFLANNLISPIGGNSNLKGCGLAILATIAGVLGMYSYSKTSKSTCSKSFRCGIMFLSECVFCCAFIPLGKNDYYYNELVYFLFVANLCLAFSSYTIIDMYGTTFLAINMALVIIWSYLYVLLFGVVTDVTSSSIATILLFDLVVIYNIWKEHTNKPIDHVRKYSKIVRFEDEVPLCTIKNIKNYSTNIDNSV